jgi:hypothetical protein
MEKANATFRPNVPIPTLLHLAWFHAKSPLPASGKRTISADGARNQRREAEIKDAEELPQ